MEEQLFFCFLGHKEALEEIRTQTTLVNTAAFSGLFDDRLVFAFVSIDWCL
jgi:hypothetical protein